MIRAQKKIDHAAASLHAAAVLKDKAAKLERNAKLLLRDFPAAEGLFLTSDRRHAIRISEHEFAETFDLDRLEDELVPGIGDEEVAS